MDSPQSWQDSHFLTFDVDWACDDVLAHAIDVVEGFDVAATWFVTHATPLLARLRANAKFELGIHPNFNPLLQGRSDQGATAAEVIDRLIELVPEARSVRSHSVAQSSPVLDLFVSRGLTHDCNHFIPEHAGIELKPWRLTNGLTKVPYFWEDGDACVVRPNNAPIASLVGRRGLRVFNYHPIHVFLNTDTLDRYEKSRSVHRDPKMLLQHRCREQGSQTALETLLRTPLMRVAIIGRGEVLLDAARRLTDDGHTIALVITAREAPEYTVTAEDLKAAAASWGAPFINTPRIEEASEALGAAKADIGVSLNYISIIPQSFIDRFRLGILNGHGGDLPRYRGNACQAWAILNGEDRVGLCVHRMVGGEVDSGDIIARDYFPLSLETTITSVHAWMRERTPALFSEALTRLSEDPSYVLERQSTNPQDALRCYPRRPEDGRIDWRRSAVDVLRLVNASNRPYAGAFCHFNGRKLIVWQAALAPPERFLAVPGQVTAIGAGFVDVATGEGKLRLMQVEADDGVVSPDTMVRSISQRLD